MANSGSSTVDGERWCLRKADQGANVTIILALDPSTVGTMSLHKVDFPASIALIKVSHLGHQNPSKLLTPQQHDTEGPFPTSCRRR